MSETHVYRVTAVESTRLSLDARIGHPDIALLPKSKIEFLYQLFVSTKYGNDPREEPPEGSLDAFRAAGEVARAKLESLSGTTMATIPTIETATALEEWEKVAGKVISSVTFTLEPEDAEVAFESAIGVVLPDGEEAFAKVTIEVVDPVVIAHLMPGMYWDSANVTIADD